jgi:hypothetical protein
MIKKVILGSLLSIAVLLMVGTAAFAGTPPASCAAHCATTFGGQAVGGIAQGDFLGGPGFRLFGGCANGGLPTGADICCVTWAAKFTGSQAVTLSESRRGR